MKELRKRVSVVVVHDNKILGFNAEDPYSKKKYVFLPGGVPEIGESLLDAAKRETLEETGYKVRIKNEQGIFRKYDFEWNGKTHDCETHYFVGQLESIEAKSVSDASYHKGVVWIPVAEMEDVFNYHESILTPLKNIVGKYIGTFNQIDYYSNRFLDPSEVAALYEDSGIVRPTKNIDRISKMYANSNLVLSAWKGDRLAGVARSLTDFSYCCYLSDLAVGKNHQKSGIGTKLVDLTRVTAGPQSMLLLLSAPNAMDYYPRIGFEAVQNGFIIRRSE